MKGFSITLCFGKYAGFYTRFQDYSWRICLGWVALTIYPRTDLEAFIDTLVMEVKLHRLEKYEGKKK